MWSFLGIVFFILLVFTGGIVLGLYKLLQGLCKRSIEVDAKWVEESGGNYYALDGVFAEICHKKAGDLIV